VSHQHLSLTCHPDTIRGIPQPGLRQEQNTKADPRHEFFYFNDNGLLVNARIEDWKLIFCEQRAPGGLPLSRSTR
jgi:hypothetical protein